MSVSKLGARTDDQACLRRPNDGCPGSRGVRDPGPSSINPAVCSPAPHERFPPCLLAQVSNPRDLGHPAGFETPGPSSINPAVCSPAPNERVPPCLLAQVSNPRDLGHPAGFETRDRRRSTRRCALQRRTREFHPAYSPRSRTRETWGTRRGSRPGTVVDQPGDPELCQQFRRTFRLPRTNVLSCVGLLVLWTLHLPTVIVDAITFR